MLLQIGRVSSLSNRLSCLTPTQVRCACNFKCRATQIPCILLYYCSTLCKAREAKVERQRLWALSRASGGHISRSFTCIDVSPDHDVLAPWGAAVVFHPYSISQDRRAASRLKPCIQSHRHAFTHDHTQMANRPWLRHGKLCNAALGKNRHGKR